MISLMAGSFSKDDTWVIASTAMAAYIVYCAATRLNKPHQKLEPKLLCLTPASCILRQGASSLLLTLYRAMSLPYLTPQRYILRRRKEHDPITNSF